MGYSLPGHCPENRLYSALSQLHFALIPFTTIVEQELKAYNGSKFDFRNFIDHNSGFIVEKTKFGKPIKAYELPGLWNGAMANWITIFVEVPLITFNPVKTVNDLLKPAHQNH